MSWLAPHWLWLLAAAPLAAALVLHAHARRRRAAQQFVGAVLGPRLLPALDRGRAISRAVLLAVGFALAALAAAGPSWGTREEVITTQGVDVVVALDVSRSMLSENEALTPLARAKASLERLVRENPGDRLGLVLFAGGAAQSCVLTSDYGFFLDALRNAEPSDAGRGGTRVGTALFAAHRVLEPRWFAVHRKLFELVSDAALVRANQEKLCALLGVPTSADLEQELVRLFDPRWLEEHERELASVFGESWSSSDLDDEAELRFEADGDAENDPRRGGKIVVLVTDGIDQGSMPALAARLLARRGIRLVTVGVGREGSGERPLVIAGQPQRTRDGAPIQLEFASEPLRELARLGQGFYVGTDELLHLAERYRAEFPELEETRGRRMTLRRGIERYPFFLGPALLCLALYFATPATRRATASSARAALALLLAALPCALGACGDELSRRTTEALAALEAGEAKRADDVLRALQQERPEDPRLAYDRGLALQALGDRGGAEREYRKARTGSRSLAARAAFNQGTLALDALREQLGRGEQIQKPEELPASERAAFEDGIARAQVAFEEASRLDAELLAATQAERDLVRWRASLRDAWRRADAAARRAELEQTQGVAFVEKLEAWLKEIRALAPLDALGAALRERELIDALPLLAERIGADEALPVPQRDALGARARALEAPLATAADALEQLELATAEEAQRQIEQELAGIWTAWAPLDAALKRLVADGSAIVALEDGARSSASAAVAERTRTWIERDAARSEALLGPAATAWIREALPSAEEALREHDADETALQRAAERFQDAGAALELDALQALPILERLAREQESLPQEIESGSERASAAQGRNARGTAIAREEIAGEPAPEGEVSAAELEARARARELLVADLDAAESEMRAALEASANPAARRNAAREAANRLREAWAKLAAFDALLRHGIDSARRAAGGVEQPRAEDLVADAGAAIARLRARLPLEIERLQRVADAPSAGGEEDPDEAAEIAKLLRDADPELGQARDAALQSAEALGAGRRDDARKGCEDAAGRLARVEAEIEEARKSLIERVELALTRESKARATLCDALESAEEATRKQTLEALRTEHAELDAEAARLRRSLQRELSRRERLAEQQRRQREEQPADPNAPVPPPSPDDSAELRAEVETAVAALELLGATIAVEDAEVTLRAIEEAHHTLRAPWNRLADFEPLVRGAIEEQRAVIERTRLRPASARAKRFARDLQGETRGQLDPILRKAPPAPPAQPGAGEPSGAAAEPDPGSVARKNVPLAREAMLSAETALESEDPTSAVPFEEEALRLLEEILQSDDQQQQQPQDQQQPNPDEGEDEQQQQGSAAAPPQAGSASLSREEIERLLRLARERKPRESSAEQRPRSAVEEDH